MTDEYRNHRIIVERTKAVGFAGWALLREEFRPIHIAEFIETGEVEIIDTYEFSRTREEANINAKKWSKEIGIRLDGVL